MNCRHATGWLIQPPAVCPLFLKTSLIPIPLAAMLSRSHNKLVGIKITFLNFKIMKKLIILFIAILLNIQYSFSQITLQNVSSIDTPDRSVKLSLSGLKYVSIHKDIAAQAITYFKLYNPDHSVFKTITIPTWTGKKAASVHFVSETLFDLDTLIEYEVNYSDAGMGAMRICNENSVILLERDTATLVGSPGYVIESGFIPGGIFPDGINTKLMVYKGYGASSTQEIYNLPGQLACLECSNGVISGLFQQPNLSVEDRVSIASPNPFTDFVKIKYALPANTKHAFVYLFDITGNLIKKKEIDNHFNETIITSDEIKQGAYIYQIVADNVVIANNKIIKL